MKNIPEFLKMSWDQANLLDESELRKNYFYVDCKSASNIKTLVFLQRHGIEVEDISDTGEDDESLSLLLGSLIHEALETSWEAFANKYAFVDKSLLEDLEKVERVVVEAESPFLAYMEKYSNANTKALKATVSINESLFSEFNFKSKETYDALPSSVITAYTKICKLIEEAFKKATEYLSQLKYLNDSGKIILDWEYHSIGKKGEDIFQLVKQGYDSAIGAYTQLLNLTALNYYGSMIADRKELPILWKHEDIELKSMLDRVKEYDKFTLIIDYKTGVSDECKSNYIKYKQYYQFSMYSDAYKAKFPHRAELPILFVQVYINPYKGIAHNAFISSSDMNLAKFGGVLKPFGDVYSHNLGIRTLKALCDGKDYPFIDLSNPFSSYVVRGWSEVLKASK